MNENQNAIKEIIQRRRLQILVHSYIYYRLNDMVVPNATFDHWARELIDLQKKYPELCKEVALYDIFADFDSIGCASMLPLDGDEKLAKRAQQLLDQHTKL